MSEIQSNFSESHFIIIIMIIIIIIIIIIIRPPDKSGYWKTIYLFLI